MKKVVNILTIDGGGIRGVLPAEVLKYVELKLQILTNNMNTRISDHFDLIVGTSTGGILTCLYTCPNKNGRPKYNAEEAADLYLKHGTKIFTSSPFYKLKSVFSYHRPKYDGKKFEKLLNTYFSDENISNATTNIMITSVNTVNNDLFLFKSLKAKYDKNSNYSFKDVARSTSAAPTFFPSHRLYEKGKEMSLVDGGLAINNPSVAGYTEAEKMFEDAKVFNLLSIGTGRPSSSFSYKETKKWGKIKWIVPISKVMLAAVSKATDYIIQSLYNSNIKGEYLRIEPTIGNANDDMDDASKENLELLRLAGIKSVKIYKNRIDSFLEKIIKD